MNIPSRSAGKSASHLSVSVPSAYTSCALLMLCVFMSSCGSINPGGGGKSSTESRLFTVPELSQDFRQFRTILERKTAGLYTDRARLSAMLDEMAATLTEPRTEAEFYRLLAPAVAELRCGHSSLSVSESAEARLREEALFFPLEVRIFGRDLVVVSDPHGTGVEPGSMIVAIDGMPSRDVVDRICANMSTDGRDSGRPRYDAERWFASMYYGYIGSPDRFELTIIPPGADAASPVTVAAVRDPSLAKSSKGIVHDIVDAPYSMSFHDRHAVLGMPALIYTRTKAYEEFLEEFFSALAARRIDTLVLDLRGNYGGTPMHTAELFKYIIDRPLPFFAKDNPVYLAPWKRPIRPSPLAFKGNLLVLIDEAAFSMNSFLLSVLRYNGIGTFVGAPSSGSHACSDAAKDAVLRNTGLRVTYSTQVFTTAVEDQESGIGLEPDIRVDWTVEDYLAGRDPVLEAALAAANL